MPIGVGSSPHSIVGDIRRRRVSPSRSLFAGHENSSRAILSGACSAGATGRRLQIIQSSIGLHLHENLAIVRRKKGSVVDDEILNLLHRRALLGEPLCHQPAQRPTIRFKPKEQGAQLHLLRCSLYHMPLSTHGDGARIISPDLSIQKRCAISSARPIRTSRSPPSWTIVHLKAANRTLPIAASLPFNPARR
jgi:hypothetical protein